MPDSNWGSRWWRNRIGKRWNSSCKISKETVAGIEISFKEKDIKYLEFLFVSYTDDSIRKDHDWELFDPRIGFLARYGMYRQIFNMIPQDLFSFK
ncbi:hypothetical protein MKX03_018193 [Papaver bracteatum]|nr:hypothetical protein MKX03_018193 [Papaver bracteatum]